MRTFVLALGGALGALARYALSRLLPPPATGFPIATFLVNLIGAFALGVFLGWWDRDGRGDGLLPPFVAVGILGGLTTFSTLAFEVVDRLDHRAGGVAMGYLAATVIAGIAAIGTGARAGRRLAATP